jgi:Zn-dependent protease with chaperone function
MQGFTERTDLAVVFAPGKIEMRKWLALEILVFALASTPSIITPPRLLHASPITREQAAAVRLSQASGSLQGSVRPLEAQGKVTAYTLPPDLYKRAKTLSRIHFLFNLISFFYGLFVLWLALRWKLAAKYRDWAEKLSSNRFLQTFVFTPPLILTIAVLESPTAIYEHIVSRTYGLSVEGWGALAWDWAKGIFILIVLGSILTWILYGVIRRSSRRWWLYFWLVSLPIIVFLSFVEPFVLEPMFFKFAPLQEKDPALVTQIERVVERSGLSIPPNRMFWMKASDKTPLMNAYVTGLGASKRIVVWDTTIEKETTPEIVSVVGHEMGHYVLGHVWKGLIFSMAVLFVLLYLGYRCVGWVLARCGPGWGIRELDDWASLPALLLLLSIFTFVSDPISNAYSRHIEHQADVYGVEVTHGILPDAGQAAADSFQVEGESALADPDPNPLNVFLFYDHPPISDRVRFCLTYNPWAEGKRPQFVK